MGGVCSADAPTAGRRSLPPSDRSSTGWGGGATKVGGGEGGGGNASCTASEHPGLANTHARSKPLLRSPHCPRNRCMTKTRHAHTKRCRRACALPVSSCARRAMRGWEGSSSPAGDPPRGRPRTHRHRRALVRPLCTLRHHGHTRVSQQANEQRLCKHQTKCQTAGKTRVRALGPRMVGAGAKVGHRRAGRHSPRRQVPPGQRLMRGALPQPPGAAPSPPEASGRSRAGHAHTPPGRQGPCGAQAQMHACAHAGRHTARGATQTPEPNSQRSKGRAQSCATGCCAEAGQADAGADVAAGAKAVLHAAALPPPSPAGRRPARPRVS